MLIKRKKGKRNETITWNLELTLQKSANLKPIYQRVRINELSGCIVQSVLSGE